MEKIGFLKRLFLKKRSSEGLSYGEEVLGSREKREVFARFWRENEAELSYLLEVLVYLESQKDFGRDLREFKRGMGVFVDFFRVCFEEEELARGEEKGDNGFVAGF